MAMGILEGPLLLCGVWVCSEERMGDGRSLRLCVTFDRAIHARKPLSLGRCSRR